MPPILFAEWKPDAPDLGASAREALGVIAELDGYRPFKALGTTSSALTARAQGAAWFRTPGGTTANFSGDATKLYHLVGSTWTDVSRTVGGAYSTGGTDSWRFSQFKTKAYATNGVDALQSFDLAAGTNWVAAAGSPPVGKYTGVVGNFLVLANIAGAPMRTKWAGDNNSGTWTPSATTLSDEQDHPDGGEITGFVGGSYGLVMQEAAIRLMTFEGSPTIFRFDVIATDLGATIPNTVAGWGDLAFFCHRSGFHMVAGGRQIVPFGRDKFDRWFWDRVDMTNMHRVTSAIDPVNSLYMVSFPTGGSGQPNEMLIYNWKANRASRALIDCEMIYGGATQQSWTLEDLDVFGAIEDVPFSLDSPYWTGARQLLLSGFAMDHKSGPFSGANVEAALQTGEYQPMPNRRGRVRFARPLVDGGLPTMTVGVRKTQQGSVAWTSPRAMTPDGRVPLRAQGRYIRFGVGVPAGSQWDWAQGIDEVIVTPTGFR